MNGCGRQQEGSSDQTFGAKQIKVVPQARESPMVLWLILVELPTLTSKGVETLGQRHWRGSRRYSSVSTDP